MTRARAILCCAISGHRWGVRTPSGLLAPRCICSRCGTPHSAPLTPREALAALPALLLAALVGVAVALIAGGGR